MTKLTGTSKQTGGEIAGQSAGPQQGEKAVHSIVKYGAKALEAKKAKTAARRASALRRDFPEAGRWLEMASARDLTLPPWGEPLTTGLMENWLRKCGMPVSVYFRLAGESSLRDFAANNPGWPARAWAGIVLEFQAKGKKWMKEMSQGQGSI
jgi:hypothetical protein